MVAMKCMEEKPNCYSKRVQNARRCNKVHETLLKTKVETIEFQRHQSMKMYNNQILELRTGSSFCVANKKTLGKRPHTAPAALATSSTMKSQKNRPTSLVIQNRKASSARLYRKANSLSIYSRLPPELYSLDYKASMHDYHVGDTNLSLMNVSDVSDNDSTKSNALTKPGDLIRLNQCTNVLQSYVLPKLPYNNPGFSLYCSEVLSESTSVKSSSRECLALPTHFEKPFQRSCCRYRHLWQPFKGPFHPRFLSRKHFK